MDAASVGYILAGVSVGWVLRGVFSDRQEQPRCVCVCVCVCVCDCHCAVQRAAESSSSSVWVVALIILCAIAILGAAGFALAVKLTFVHKGEEREVAIHLKGKSKGVYNPAKPLQILG